MLMLPNSTTMSGLTTRLSLILGLSANIVMLWLALTPGLVLCLEQDGRVVVEVSDGVGGCSDVEPNAERAQGHLLLALTAGDCDGCRDIALYLSADIAVAHPHVTSESPAESPTVPALDARVVAPCASIPVLPVRSLRTSSRSTTILRV
mgnify:FL=1|jgi:hypothetical protein